MAIAKQNILEDANQGRKPRVYLDMCCFNRPYDDQSQLRVSLEIAIVNPTEFVRLEAGENNE